MEVNGLAAFLHIFSVLECSPNRDWNSDSSWNRCRFCLHLCVDFRNYNVSAFGFLPQISIHFLWGYAYKEIDANSGGKNASLYAASQVAFKCTLKHTVDNVSVSFICKCWWNSELRNMEYRGFILVSVLRFKKIIKNNSNNHLSPNKSKAKYPQYQHAKMYPCVT